MGKRMKLCLKKTSVLHLFLMGGTEVRGQSQKDNLVVTHFSRASSLLRTFHLRLRI